MAHTLRLLRWRQSHLPRSGYKTEQDCRHFYRVFTKKGNDERRYAEFSVLCSSFWKGIWRVLRQRDHSGDHRRHNILNVLAAQARVASVFYINAGIMKIEHNSIFALPVELGRRFSGKESGHHAPLWPNCQTFVWEGHDFQFQTAIALVKKDRGAAPFHATLFYRHTRALLKKLHFNHSEAGKKWFPTFALFLGTIIQQKIFLPVLYLLMNTIRLSGYNTWEGSETWDTNAEAQEERGRPTMRRMDGSFVECQESFQVCR